MNNRSATDNGDEHINAPNKTLTIPISEKTLGEFISNLLGQRRRLSRRFDVLFNLDWNWLYNLDDLITQRVEHQNGGQTVSFSARIYFDNGRISDLITREDFRAYRDISDVQTIAIEVNWAFLVKFPLAKVPEKQEIKFVARTKQIASFDAKGSDEKLKIGFFDQLKIQEEDFYLEVFYSNVTWGEDMMNLVSSHVGSTFSRRNRFLPFTINFLVRFSPVIALVVFFLCPRSTRSLLRRKGRQPLSRKMANAFGIARRLECHK